MLIYIFLLGLLVLGRGGQVGSEYSISRRRRRRLRSCFDGDGQTSLRTEELTNSGDDTSDVDLL